MSELAIQGGTPVRTEPYPGWPVFDERDVQVVSDVVRSGNWGGFPYPGPHTAEFLRRFLEMQGGEHAVAAANGTITLEVALRAAGIGWGDEVIVPAYTFQATAAGPMAAGAIPVIADIDPATYCLDPAAVESAITLRTRAIIPVHVGQQMADMDAIMEIAGRHDLIVVEDAAHAHGARWRDRGAGAIGHFGSFSMQSTKILTAGEGGILICRTQELADRAASIIDCGRPHDPEEKEYTFGANYRMSELHAGLANAQLDRFPDQMREREESAAYLDEALSEIPGVRVLRRDPRHTRRAFYRYLFAIDPDAFGTGHGPVCAALEAEGIPAFAGWPPMHRYPMFQPQLSRLPVPSAFAEYFRFDRMRFPAAERAADHEAVWLDEAVLRAGRQGVEDVVAAVRKVWENRGDLG
jgi:dTDP-4-amino-4,6-dideoxygalactose transaminase